MYIDVKIGELCSYIVSHPLSEVTNILYLVLVALVILPLVLIG